jgi:TolB-like protein
MKRFAFAAALALAAAALADRPRVAVLYFDYDKDDDYKVLKKGFAQMLITDLAGNDAITVVERARMQELMDELKLQQTDKIDQATAAKLGKILGAKWMLFGSYFLLGGKMAVDVRLVDVETFALAKGAKARMTGDDFMEAEQKISKEINFWLSGQATKMANEPPRRVEAPKPPAKLPMATAVKYSKALDAIDKKDKEGAKRQLAEVVKEQPDFALAALDLAALSK